ncbi:MAG: hypothetical protein ACI9U2_001408 [Bradymonadia bacterium]|jgi:hypothetical protein
MDDGFDWLESLPPDLYADLDRLMDFVAEGDHAGVDGLVPGIVARARRDKNAWVEVFARNFELRSLILHRGDTRQGMAKAIALLDRAHEPDARDCPQSICTAHAVCAAYGFRDGPGFVADRLAVSAETLARTNPSRVCWVCISNEHADALVDDGRPQEALDFIDRQSAIRVGKGAPLDPDDFGLRQATALLALGRVDDALAQVEAAACDYRGASWQRGWRQHKARLLAEKGEHAAAITFLSSAEDVERDGGFQLHFDTLPLLYESEAVAEADDFSDNDILTQMVTLGKVALSRGIARAGHLALLWAAETLIDSGEAQLATCVLDHATAALPELCTPAPFKIRVDALQARINARPTPAPSATPTSLDQAIATFAVTPSPALALSIARTWQVFNEDERAGAVLTIAADAHPDDETLFQRRCELLLQAANFDALAAVLRRPPATIDGPLIALRVEAQAARQRGDVEARIDALMAVHVQRPAWTANVAELGQALWGAGRFDEAGAVWAVAADGEDPNQFDWLCIQAATAVDDWRTVRTHAMRTGLQVELTDDPLMGHFGYVHVTLPDEARPMRAELISPAIARVLSLRSPGSLQWHGAEVLVAPWPQNADARDDPDWVALHTGLIVRMRPPIQCVAIDGVDPGDSAKEALWSALSEAGFAVQNSAGADYMVVDPATDASTQGMYWLVATLPERAAALLAICDEIVGADAPGVGLRVWPELLRLLELDTRADAHDALAKAWGMV